MSTHENIEQLQAAGFSSPQAHAITKVGENTILEAVSNLATKDDLQILKAELNARFAEIQAETNTRFAEIGTRFAEIQAETNTRFAEQTAHFERSLRIQLATILSTFIAVTGLSIAIIKLL